MQSDATSRFGLLGRKLTHSWSPRIHRLLGSVPYGLFEREPNEVENFIRYGSWQGLNVTIPYKAQAFALADEVSARARRVGVANTLIRRNDGTIFADNSDIGGFVWMLKRFYAQQVPGADIEALRGAPVVVLGSGGASHAVQAALEEFGARVSVISRAGSDTYDGLVSRHQDAQLLINTTPVGMYPYCPDSPLKHHELEGLSQLRGVLDVVYNPTRTGICLEAEQLGIPYASGLAMLIAQAALSSELFLGVKHPEAKISSLEAKLSFDLCNICLIGMPGVGKTSTGTILARRLQRPFIDMDEAFRLQENMHAGDFIASYGEAAFRSKETQILAAYAKNSGLVIACGGGVVTKPENYSLLHQNGMIVMLDRPLTELSIKKRPLSQSRGIQQLADERMPHYQSWADMIIAGTGSPISDAAAIVERLSVTSYS